MVDDSSDGPGISARMVSWVTIVWGKNSDYVLVLAPKPRAMPPPCP